MLQISANLMRPECLCRPKSVAEAERCLSSPHREGSLTVGRSSAIQYPGQVYVARPLRTELLLQFGAFAGMPSKCNSLWVMPQDYDESLKAWSTAGRPIPSTKRPARESALGGAAPPCKEASIQLCTHILQPLCCCYAQNLQACWHSALNDSSSYGKHIRICILQTH